MKYAYVAAFEHADLADPSQGKEQRRAARYRTTVSLVCTWSNGAFDLSIAMTTEDTMAASSVPAVPLTGGASAVSDTASASKKNEASAAPASAPAPTVAPAQNTGAAQPQRRKAKKSKKPPVKDTVTVLIPLHVTADLGVAMRRSRTKRTRRLHELYPEMAPNSSGGGGRKGYGKDAKQAEVEGDDSGDEEVAEKSGSGKKGKQAKGAGEGDDSSRGDLSPAPSASGGGPGVMRREDYGSVLDYLEAKYVRGVQIGGMEVLDEDDGASSGEGKNKKGRGSPKYAAEADDYSGEGSVYSDECSDDGFLDDSMLRHEVVEQVMATGKYGGRTKVEDEARKERRGSGKDDGGSGSDAEDTAAAGGEEFNDDAFFVNVGDIELAEGEDHDGINQPIDWNAIAKESKGGGKAKKGRKRKKKADTGGGADGAGGGGKKSKKDTATKGKGKEEEKSAKKKKKIKSKDGADDATTASGTSKKSTASKASSSKKKKDDGADKKKKKTDKVKSPKKAASPAPVVASAAASLVGSAAVSSSDDDDEEGSTELSSRAIHLANEAAKLKAASDKLHRACIREVKKCTEDDLPIVRWLDYRVGADGDHSKGEEGQQAPRISTRCIDRLLSGLR